MRFPGAVVCCGARREDGGLSEVRGQYDGQHASHSGISGSCVACARCRSDARLAALPSAADRRPDPARAIAAAIIAPAAVEAGAAEIVPIAAIVIFRRKVRIAAGGAARTEHRNGLVGRLAVAGQEAVAMPAGAAVPLLRGGGRAQVRLQQCEDDDREGQDAQHDGSLVGPSCDGDSNHGAFCCRDKNGQQVRLRQRRLSYPP